MLWPYAPGRPPARERALIDAWLPPGSWMLERHALELPMEPSAALAAMIAVRLKDMPYVGGLFALRGIPARSEATVSELFRTPPFITLADEPGRERVGGIVGPFWKFGHGRMPADVPATPEAFREATARGRIAAIANFRAEPHPRGSLLSTETWVTAARRADAAAFTAYWVAIGPFSAWIRRLMLRAARDRLRASAAVS